MLCRRCGLRESTGIVIHLCDECYDMWEAEVQADPTPGKQNVDISPIDSSIKTETLPERINSCLKN